MFKLHSEFKEFFQENNIGYFVSYYENTLNPVLHNVIKYRLAF